MKIKEFLKLETRKKMIFVILFIIANFDFFFVLFTTGGDVGYFELVGFPLRFYKSAVCSNFGEPYGVTCGGGFFSLPYLIFNIIFWYVVSCLIVWIYDKVKKK